GSVGLLMANHFVPAWHQPYQSPWNAMNMVVRSAYVNGVPLMPGDEIALYDGSTCVGMTVVDRVMDHTHIPLIVNASTEGGDVPGSARIGEFIIFKMWVQATNTEYSYPDMSVYFDVPVATHYEGLGTAFIDRISYTTPSSDASIPIADNDYAPIPMTYEGANLSITALGARYYGVPFNTWVPNVVTTGGDIRVIYIPTPPIGVGFIGTAPAVYSQYHWYIDPGTVGFTADEAHPVVFEIDTTGLTGFIDYTDVLVYKRSIHGTPSFEACNTVWDPPYLRVSVTSFSEFVLGGPISSTLPVELSSFTASISTGNSVMLYWISQSETNLSGYRIFRSAQPELESAIMLDTFVDATNSSQTQAYVFYDTELEEAGTYYYWLQSLDLNGSNEYHGPAILTYSPLEPHTPPVVYEQGLNSIYPNPFNPSTTIFYALDTEQNVKLDIYNVRGQLVNRIDCGRQAAGAHRIEWNGTDQNGTGLGSGMYLIRLDLGLQQYTRKAVLSK
ncbi:MAG: FlgD immunoglobulin-like domain containing protein, partial [Candidatus Cloacimonadota bacterium]